MLKDKAPALARKLLMEAPEEWSVFLWQPLLSPPPARAVSFVSLLTLSKS